MCGVRSVALVKDSHYSALSTGSTFAHVMGLLFDMDHDNSEYLSLLRYYAESTH